jgi:hypothetical protein
VSSNGAVADKLRDAAIGVESIAELLNALGPPTRAAVSLLRAIQ